MRWVNKTGFNSGYLLGVEMSPGYALLNLQLRACHGYLGRDYVRPFKI